MAIYIEKVRVDFGVCQPLACKKETKKITTLRYRFLARQKILAKSNIHSKGNKIPIA